MTLNTPNNRSKLPMIAMILAALLAAPVLDAFCIVNPGEVGVVVRLGNVTGVAHNDPYQPLDP